VVYRRYQLAVIAVLVATVLYRTGLRAYLKQASANVRAFDVPTAGMYDLLVASVLEGFYARVAGGLAAAYPRGTLLEIGSGPGRLAVRLAREVPDLAAIGVDISDAMVERAARRATGAGLSERVRFEGGDVGALPFFDGVVSTLSLHHWPDPVRGLSEIHRVLKPGGEARIYDLAHWLWRPAQGGDRLAQIAAAIPFGGGNVEVVRWPGAVPTFVLLCLRLRREVGLWAPDLNLYELSASAEAVAQLRELAAPLEGARILHVNATPFGGGVAGRARDLYTSHRSVSGGRQGAA
jgi:SAM-dependent methyltransferase